MLTHTTQQRQKACVNKAI